MAAPKTQTTSVTGVHHRFRTFVSSIFGFFALALIIMSILVVWLDRTLTNTSTYVSTVAPLVTKADVQNFVVTKASSALLDNNDAPVGDIASKLLTPDVVAGKTNDQLKAAVTPILTDSLRSVVASPAFASLWKDNNKAIHAQLMSQLNSNSQVINLNFRPVITGLIDQLGSTKLAFVKDKFDLPADAGQVTIQGKQLSNVRKVYDYFQKAMLAIIVCAIFAAALCVLISVHHLKTARRIALLTGIFSAVLALLLSATSLIKAGNDPQQQKFVVALVNGITHDLRISLIVIAVLGIGGAIGSKVYAAKMGSRGSVSAPAKRA